VGALELLLIPVATFLFTGKEKRSSTVVADTLTLFGRFDTKAAASAEPKEIRSLSGNEAQFCGNPG
jgi:hypothetical protein